MKRGRTRQADRPLDAGAPTKEALAAKRLADLARDNPFPELPDSLQPFYYALDGGGRQLVTDAIQERNVSLMAEIGCFLCGSTRRWLESSPQLTVIGIDPWDDNWGNYIRKKVAAGHGSIRTLADPLATAQSVEEYGNYRAALRNVEAWRDRFIPVRRRSPEALSYLRRRNVYPDMIYIDAYKEEEDLQVAHELFPGAVLCGDDWDWRDEDGELVMRLNVQRFADDFGFSITADGATWLLTRTGPPAAKRSSARLVRPSEPHDAERDELVRRGIASAVLTRFAAVIDRPDLHDTMLLMLGCGAAGVEVAIDTHLERYVGTSTDRGLIEHLRDTVGDDRFAFHHFDPATMGAEVPIGEETFDLICAVSTFDHLDPERYQALLKTLGRHASAGAKLAYTVLLDELTPGGHGALDAFARSLGEEVAGSTEQFRDFLPEDPLRMALYERSFARELLRGTGWECIAIADPEPPLQHLLIAQRVADE